MHEVREKSWSVWDLIVHGGGSQIFLDGGTGFDGGTAPSRGMVPPSWAALLRITRNLLQDFLKTDSRVLPKTLYRAIKDFLLTLSRPL